MTYPMGASNLQTEKDLRQLSVKCPRMNSGGRPRIQIDTETIMRLRSEGRSWRAIEKLTGVSARTARRAVRDFPLVRGKTQETPAAKPILEAPAAKLGQPETPNARVFGFARGRRPRLWGKGVLAIPC